MKKILCALCAFLLLSGCAARKNAAEVQFFAMDTVMTVTVYGKQAEEAARAVQAEINRLDRLWSRTRADSDVSRINDHAGDGSQVAISPDTAELLTAALEIMEESGGAFNPMLAPVMDAWGFTKEERRVPGRDELDELLKLTQDPPQVVCGKQFENASACLPLEGQKLDLGGIAKGLATAIGARAAQSYEVDGLLLDLGGNLYTQGRKPDGSDWRVGVKDPQNTGKLLCTFLLDGRTCATSGGYERYFEENGVTYHHIIDPTDGYPADRDLLSVTVVGDPALADAWSTAFFVLGSERALELWRGADSPVGEADLILVTGEDHVYVTEGLEKGFDFRGEENGYTYEIVSR